MADMANRSDGVLKPMKVTGPAVEMREDRPEITASEIGAFYFCARNWWLGRVKDMEASGPRVQEGREVHAQVGRLLVRTAVLETAVKVCAGIAVLAVVVAVALQLFSGAGR